MGGSVSLVHGHIDKVTYQIVRCWNGSKGYGKKFDTLEDAREYLRNDERVQEDKINGFIFSIEEVVE